MFLFDAHRAIERSRLKILHESCMKIKVLKPASLSKDRDMKIRVQLYTIFKKYGKGKIDEKNYMRLPEHETLHGLAAYLGIPERQGKVFLVNGSPRPEEYKLREEDEVKILGFIGGG